jgi:hypothetical protein
MLHNFKGLGSAGRLAVAGLVLLLLLAGILLMYLV